ASSTSRRPIAGAKAGRPERTGRERSFMAPHKRVIPRRRTYLSVAMTSRGMLGPVIVVPPHVLEQGTGQCPDSGLLRGTVARAKAPTSARARNPDIRSPASLACRPAGRYRARTQPRRPRPAYAPLLLALLSLLT